MKVPQKTRVAIWSSDPTPGHIPRQNCNSKRDVHPCVHSSTIYNSQDMETTQMSTDPLTDEWIKNICVYIYNLIPFAATWMDLEIIIGSKVSQKKTNTIWYHLYVEPKILHKWAYWWNRNRLTEIENRLTVAKGKSTGREGLGVWN